MKKLLIATNLLTLLTAFYFGMEARKEKTAHAVTTQEVAGSDTMPSNMHKNLGASRQFTRRGPAADLPMMAGSKFKPCATMTCRSYANARITMIDPKLAKKMSHAYGNDPFKRWISGPNMPPIGDDNDDATSIWFNLETLKAYIWKIENELCRQNVQCLKLGIRIYYGKYPASTAFPGEADLRELDPKYAKRHTLFMVPTYYRDSVNHDFNPWLLGENKCKPLTYPVILTKPFPAGVLSGVFCLAGTDYALNHGDLAPPPRGEGLFGGDDE